MARWPIDNTCDNCCGELSSSSSSSSFSSGSSSSSLSSLSSLSSISSASSLSSLSSSGGLTSAGLSSSSLSFLSLSSLSSQLNSSSSSSSSSASSQSSLSSEGFSSSSSSSGVPQYPDSKSVYTGWQFPNDHGYVQYSGGGLICPVDKYGTAGEQVVFSVWMKFQDNTGPFNLPAYYESGGSLDSFYIGNYSGIRAFLCWTSSGCHLVGFALGSGWGVWRHYMVAYSPNATPSSDQFRAWLNGSIGLSGPTFHGDANPAPSFSRVGFSQPTGSRYTKATCLGIWKFPSGSNLSIAQLSSMASYLYNSGNALFYQNMSGANAHLSNLVNFYNFNEPADGNSSVTFYDQVGGNHMIGVMGAHKYPFTTSDFPP